MMNKNSFKQVVTADSPFLAKELANELYGENNYEIIDGYYLTQSQCWGFVKKDVYNLLIELTKEAAQKANSQNSGATSEQHTNKMPSQTAMQKTSEIKPSISYEPQEDIIPDFVADEPANSDPLNHSEITYVPKIRHKMRDVGGIRSIQEGDTQPHSQKIDDNENFANNDMLVANQLLEHIHNLKATRGHSTIVDLVTPTKKDKDSKEVNEFLTKRLEELMKQMQEGLSNLNKIAANSIAKPIPNCPCGLKAVKDSLINVDTPYDVADYVVKSISELIPESDQNDAACSMKACENWCHDRIAFTGDLKFETEAGPKIIALFGPTGVGKTTTIAKIAAPYTFGSPKKRKKLVFFTLDTYRLGATEQLAHYAQLYDIVLEVIYEPAELDQKLAEHFDKDLIIIDTAGRCPKKHDEIMRLNEYLSRLPNLSRYLVISATSKYIDMINAIKCFGEIGFDNLIFTKIDETCSVGPMLAVMLYSKAPLAYLTNGQNVPHDILQANDESFRQNIFGNI